MNPKRIFLAGIFAITPYVLCNYMVFIFIIPLLKLFYSNEKIKNSHLALLALLCPCVVLLPLIIYNIGTFYYLLYLSGRLYFRQHKTPVTYTLRTAL